MLHVEEILLREIRMPLREPFRVASGVQTVRRIVLLELVDADGEVGWSECVAQEQPHYMPETVETAWHALTAWLAPRVLHRTFREPAEVAPVLARGIRGHEMARAAVEMAVWELAARKRGISLSHLLGGTRSRVGVGRAVGIQPDPETLVEKVRTYRAEGYQRIKLKIKPGADVPYVRAVHEALGEDARLMVDAGSAYTLADMETFRALDACGLMMIEQPLAWDDLVRHAALQKEIQTPLCLDETLTSAARVEDMVALGSGRIVNLKPGRVGGFAASLAVHDFCRRREVPMWCGGMLESGIGRAHNVALASLPGFTLPGDISPSRRYWERDIVRPEWTMDAEGFAEVPRDRPGMGVDVDRDRIEDLTVRVQVLT